MSRSRRTRLLLSLVVMAGVATVSVAYAADVSQSLRASITIDPRIDLGSILSMIVIAGGGIGVWVKLNRDNARQVEQIRSVRKDIADARIEHRELRTVVNQILLGKQLGG